MVITAASSSSHVKTIRGLKETPQAIALRALRSITKSLSTALHLTELPRELLFGEKLDFHRWTLLLNDNTLRLVCEEQRLREPAATGTIADTATKYYFLDCASKTVYGMFHMFWTPMVCPYGILELNIANAKTVTDYGIAIIGQNNHELRKLNIAGCPKITDRGLREVAVNCQKLQSLNIASCTGIEGPGIIAVAESCPYLSRLSMIHCGHIQNYSLQKLFRKCVRLEEVYISHMKDISDEEIRILAQNSNDLVCIEAIECAYLSDQSILALSQHCKDLDSIDFSRTQMTYRISDVSLMALGQRCFTLRSLKLNQCDSITDVGLGWLTEGCKVLENLELYGCNKITDAGLRVLGNACHALTALDISTARAISDVGLSHLSKGCRALKSFKCSGAFLLSDPRFTPSDQSGKMEIWEEVIGVPALTSNCPLLESLDLSGCFRLNKVLGQCVASLHNLRTLNIKGCNQTATQALISMVAGCTLLEDLNVTDCGRAINNEFMLALSQKCLNLQVLQACRCLEIKAMGIKAIANMRKLQKLNISGCSSLNDSMLVHLTALDKTPMLTDLEACHIPKLTDSFVAWLAMKDHCLLTVNFKGTAVTSKSLTSVRDRFANSDILMNETVYGFVPKYRVADHMLMNDYYRMITGMTKIQSRYRKWKAVLRVMHIHEEFRRHAAHALLQRIARGFIARRRVLRMRTSRFAQNRASLKIASVFRVAVAKKRVSRKHRERLMRFRNQVAKRIQCAYRCYIGRVTLFNLRLDRLRRHQKRVAATTVIQSLGRMYLARIRCFRIKELRRMKDRVMDCKAELIQRCYRGFVSRTATKKYKAKMAGLKARQWRSVQVIQRNFRSHRTTSILRAMHDKRMLVRNSVIMIQALMRGARSRLHTSEMKFEIVAQRRRMAAVRIQCLCRVYVARRTFFAKIRERQRYRQRCQDAANVIIRAARLKLAWTKYTRKRKEYIQRMTHQAEGVINAAIKMQALGRRYLGRLKYFAKLGEKKNKWKELFDETKKRRFFYNKQTGEVRWRIPQDLLDLIPHPPCDNCTCTEAVLECRVCNELYCGPCFQQVHIGGRRKDHEFRALYDFYGKRLDYGDGEFPCQWPSEVMQDEVQGWMLRVAPHRPPRKIYKQSGWEEYEYDDKEGNTTMLGRAFEQQRVHASMGKDNPKVFYFNRKTFQTSYEMPVEVQQEFYSQHGFYDHYGNWIWYNADFAYDYAAAAHTGLTTAPPRTPSTAAYTAPPSAGAYDDGYGGYYYPQQQGSYSEYGTGAGHTGYGTRTGHDTSAATQQQGQQHFEGTGQSGRDPYDPDSNRYHTGYLQRLAMGEESRPSTDQQQHTIRPITKSFLHDQEQFATPTAMFNTYSRGAQQQMQQNAQQQFDHGFYPDQRMTYDSDSTSVISSARK